MQILVTASILAKSQTMVPFRLRFVLMVDDVELAELDERSNLENARD